VKFPETHFGILKKFSKIPLIRYIQGSELLKNSSILISGTVIAQLIPVLLQPLLRRFYSPETFGAYSVYLSIVGILAIVSSFKYELAIILPKNEKNSANIFFLTVIINLIFNLILFFIIFTWKDQLLKFLNLNESFSIYLYFAPVGIFFYNLYQSLNNWLVRRKAFFPVSINKFVRRGTEGISQVAFNFFRMPHGIIFGDIIGHISNIISGSFQANKTGLNLSSISLNKMKYVTLKYSDFPKYNVIPSFMSACSFLLPAILINKFYTAEYTGYFDLSKLLLSIPLALISTSISSVLLQVIAENYRENKSIMSNLKPIIILISGISILEIIVISIFGISLFKLLFGASWGYSGEISKLLVWSYALNFIVASFSAIFISMEKIKLLSIWQIFYFISILSLGFFKHLNFLDFIKVYVLIEVICYLVMISLMIFVVSRYERRIYIAL
jgi:O-antigen/teichoic acid export membrane protein